jgi:hypothetical protein
MVNIFDIAHQSAIEPRYSGATFFPYSVAQHSILVSDIIDHILYMPEYEAKIANIYQAFSLVDQYEVRRILRALALLHDASEAYLKDLPKPLKDAIPEYIIHENRLELVIYNKYLDNLTEANPAGYTLARSLVKDADIIALLTEKGQILGPPPAAWLDDFSAYWPLDIPVTYQSWDIVEQNFLNKAAYLNLSFE